MEQIGIVNSAIDNFFLFPMLLYKWKL